MPFALLLSAMICAHQAAAPVQASVPESNPQLKKMFANEIQTPGTFTNPIVHGADPWLGWSNGHYYLAVTTGRDVQLRSARTIEGLKTAKPRVVWTSETPRYAKDVWAPEFHRLDAKDGRGPRWYLYVTGSDGREPAHRMICAESSDGTLDGDFHTKAQWMTDANDEFYAIDGTVIDLPDGRMYAVWCGRPSKSGQGLYISKMKNPWTLEGERVYIDVSGFGCEFVREGPIALQRFGKVFLVYSACSADTPDYKLGMTVADQSADLLDLASWKQDPEPLFVRNDGAGVFGPGHNSFFQSPDGKEDWITYHAKPTTAVSYADRDTRLQKFEWREGRPYFGHPLSTQAHIPEPSGTKTP